MQGILGSSLWISTRTRLDLCYAHSLAASSLTQSESETKTRLSHILQYLTLHDDLGIRCPFEDERLDDEVMPVLLPEGSSKREVFSDGTCSILAFRPIFRM
eukprot:2037595-Amphidinium_carterae.1